VNRTIVAERQPATPVKRGWAISLSATRQRSIRGPVAPLFLFFSIVSGGGQSLPAVAGRCIEQMPNAQPKDFLPFQ
jgi:hypothetical protein